MIDAIAADQTTEAITPAGPFDDRFGEAADLVGDDAHAYALLVQRSQQRLDAIEGRGVHPAVLTVIVQQRFKSVPARGFAQFVPGRQARCQQPDGTPADMFSQPRMIGTRVAQAGKDVVKRHQKVGRGIDQGAVEVEQHGFGPRRDRHSTQSGRVACRK